MLRYNLTPTNTYMYTCTNSILQSLRYCSQLESFVAPCHSRLTPVQQDLKLRSTMGGGGGSSSVTVHYDALDCLLSRQHSVFVFCSSCNSHTHPSINRCSLHAPICLPCIHTYANPHSCKNISDYISSSLIQAGLFHYV